MARSWSIRPFAASDLELVRELYAQVRGTTRPQRHDYWRLLDNPVAPCPAVLAMDGERCAGVYILWPTAMQLGSETVLGAQSMDTMTHPDYRNQGMFVALAQACFDLAAERGFEVLYGFPNPLSYPGFIRRLNWDHVTDIRHWVRFLRPSHHPRLPRVLGGIADATAGMLPSGHTHGLQVALEPPDDASLDALLAEWRERRDLCRVARDRVWLDWRYAATSGMTYEWITVRRADKVVAAGVWGMRGPSWGAQADGRAKLLETLGADRHGLEAVVATALARARAEGAWLMETMTNVDPVTKLLIRAGFISHRRAPLITRSLTGRLLGGNIHLPSSWRILGGDVDTF